MRFLLLPLALMASCSLAPQGKNEAETHFLTQVKPMLQQTCLRCHNGSVPPPAPNFTSRAKAFQRSASGRDYIVPGDPAHSQLIIAVQRGGTHEKMMPRGDLHLANDQISMLRDWIVDGAYWPEGEAGNLQADMTGAKP